MTKALKGPILQTMTPDEMLDGVVKRIFARAEAYIKKFPRPIYVEGKQYRFLFDKTMIYTFSKYDGEFYRIFERSDGQQLKATRYSEPPEEITQKS